MPVRGTKSFVVAFLGQKIAELALLSLCMAVATFMIGRSPEAYSLAISNDPPPTAWSALSIGARVAATFFVFTAYPLVTLIAVWVYRKFFGGRALPLFSALVSLSYAMCWAIPTGAVSHGWFLAVTAIMVAFVWLSSSVLYPKEATSG